MLDKMESYLSWELLNRYSSELPAEHQPLSEKSFIPFLKHIKEHSYFYRINLQNRKSYPIRQGYEPMWNRIIRPQCEKAGITSEEEIAEIIYHSIPAVLQYRKEEAEISMREKSKLILIRHIYISGNETIALNSL